MLLTDAFKDWRQGQGGQALCNLIVKAGISRWACIDVKQINYLLDISTTPNHNLILRSTTSDFRPNDAFKQLKAKHTTAEVISWSTEINIGKRVDAFVQYLGSRIMSTPVLSRGEEYRQVMSYLQSKQQQDEPPVKKLVKMTQFIDTTDKWDSRDVTARRRIKDVITNNSHKNSEVKTEVNPVAKIHEPGPVLVNVNSVAIQSEESKGVVHTKQALNESRERVSLLASALTICLTRAEDQWCDKYIKGYADQNPGLILQRLYENGKECPTRKLKASVHWGKPTIVTLSMLMLL